MAMRIWLGKVQVSFSFWFFCVVALFLLSNHQVVAWYIALPILIHEAGHITVMLLCKIEIQAVEFTSVSINLKRRGSSKVSFAADIAINLAGIAANLLVALWLYQTRFQSIRIIFLIAANLAVAVFNLLPIGNLDGGTICRLICERYFMPVMARQVSRLVSFIILTPLFACSIFFVLSGVVNFTLLLTCIYLAVTVIFRD